MKKINITKKLISTVLVCAITAINVSALSGFTQTTLDISNYTTDVLLGNDAIHSDESVSSIITSDVLAAINGGFFDSYYSSGSALTFPSNVPIIYGAIIKDGMLINAGGENNMIGFTYDGEILVDRVDCTPMLVLNNSTEISTWCVNQSYSDSWAIMIMTDDLDYSFNISSGAMVFTVSNDIVTEVSTSTTQTVADGTFKVVYNSDAIANATKWEVLPRQGDTLQLTASYQSKKGESWENVKTAVSGGRMLVQNGVSVAYDTSYNAQFDTDEKQTNTSSSSRSFAGVDANGDLFLGTATGTFPEIASMLVSKGVVHAVSLDGGASSMLYTKTGGYITSAGRELASILAIKEGAETATAPVQPTITQSEQGTTTTSSSNEPSSWAVSSINQAISYGLIPDWLQMQYTSSITRREFCVLLSSLISEKTNKSIDTWRNEKGIVYDDFTFTDTDDYFVRGIAALGIVTGTGNGEFSPTDLLTREEAATMINRLLTAVELSPTTSNSVSFEDSNEISDWAETSVYYIAQSKIMNGKGTTFDPQGTYTKEEAYITMLNVYNMTY